MIFITSSYRSGGALFTRMLNVNKEVKISSGTINFFRYYFKKYNSIKNINNFRNLVNEFCNRLEYRFDIKLDRDEMISEFGKKNFDYSNIYSLFCSKIFRDKDFNTTGEHACNEWRNIKNFLKFTSNGKIIFLLRDPRDILCSFKKSTIAKKNDYLISIFNFVDLIDYAYTSKKKYNNKIHIVKFHELKKNPKAIIKKVCKFLKIKFNDKMIDEKYFTEIDGKKWNQSKIFSFSGKLKKQNVGRWKSVIDGEDLFLCELIALKQMKKMGLELSNKTFKNKEIIRGFNKITSSSLLTESFLRWISSRKGNDKFPLDPLDPKNYDFKEFKNPKIYKFQSKLV